MPPSLPPELELDADPPLDAEPLLDPEPPIEPELELECPLETPELPLDTPPLDPEVDLDNPPELPDLPLDTEPPLEPEAPLPEPDREPRLASAPEVEAPASEVASYELPASSNVSPLLSEDPHAPSAAMRTERNGAYRLRMSDAHAVAHASQIRLRNSRPTQRRHMQAPRNQCAPSERSPAEKNMKKARELPETSLDRYDWSKATRGRFAKRFPREAHAVVIDPALWPNFGCAEAVNEALRAALAVAKTIGPAKNRRTRAA